MAGNVERKQIRVTGSNEVTLPKSVLDAANLHTGDVLEIITEGDGDLRLHRIPADGVPDEEARPVRDAAWWELFYEMAGSFPGAGKRYRALRDEWDR